MGNAIKRLNIIRKLAVLTVVLALCTSVFVLSNRMSAEKANDTVAIALDLGTAKDFAYKYGYDLRQLLSQFKSYGVTSVTVKGITPERLSEDGIVAFCSAGETMILKPELSSALVAGKTYAIPRDERAAVWLRQALEFRFGQDGFKALNVPSGGTVFEVPSSIKEFWASPLFYWDDDIEIAKSSGLDVVMKLFSYPGIAERELDVIGGLIQKSNSTLVFFSSSEVPGYPAHIDYLANLLRDNGVTVGLIEDPSQLGNVDQKGLPALTELLAFRAVRVYTVPAGETRTIPAPDLAVRSMHSIVERNARVLDIRPLDKPGYTSEELIKETGKYLSDLHDLIAKRGLALGNAKVLPFLSPNQLVMLLAAIAAQACLLMVISDLFGLQPVKAARLLALLAALTAAAVFIAPTLARTLAALGIALIAPVVALWVSVLIISRKDYERAGTAELLRTGLAALVAGTLVAVCGGLFIAATLGDFRYMLEMEYFRGVKISLVLPILAAPFIYSRYYPKKDSSPRSSWGRVWSLGQLRVRILDLVLFGLVGAIAYYYVGRSGHTAGVPVAAAEVQLRTWLDMTLLVRPRVKEIAIGYPALMLIPVALKYLPDIWAMFAMCFAVMGQISVVNSFEHIRTPIMITAERTFNGLWVGGAIAVIAVLLAQVTFGTSTRKLNWPRK